LSPGSLDHRSNARRPIGNQLNLGKRTGHNNHSTQKAFAGGYWLLPARTTPSNVQDQRLRPGPVVDVDNVGRSHGAGSRRFVENGLVQSLETTFETEEPRPLFLQKLQSLT
jgi:hypothetical protein